MKTALSRLGLTVSLLALLAGCNGSAPEKSRPHPLATYSHATWKDLPPVSDSDLVAGFNAWRSACERLKRDTVWATTCEAALQVPNDATQVRGFLHAIQVVRGHYSNPKMPGEVSPFQALTTAVSGTVGLGNIAGVAVAMAESDTSVTVSAGALGGRVAGNLTVSGRGDESVAADAVAGSGGVVAGAGADARVVHEQDVSATAFTAVAGLTVVGTTTLSADRKVRYDSQTETTNASAFGGSGAVTTATLDGSATAKLGNGSTLTGAQLRVLANNDVERTDLGAESARGGGG